MSWRSAERDDLKTDRRAPLRVVGLLLLLLLQAGFSAHAGDPEAILKKFPFAEGAEKRVLGGEFLSVALPSASDRELAIAMAFVIKSKPEVIVDKLLGGIAISKNPEAVSFGKVSNPPSIKDLAELELTKNQLKRWLDAHSGSDINLSEAEIKKLNDALHAGNVKNPGREQIQTIVDAILLNRIHEYQTYGLKGIAPYLRKHGKSQDVAQELRIASAAEGKFGLFGEEVLNLLFSYPKEHLPGYREAFFWVVEGSPSGAVMCLTHRFAVPGGEGFITVQRQFYVSAGYNVEQSIAHLTPIKQGTLVVYTNRISTDMVSGFGGSVRRSIGDRMMEKQLRTLYEGVAQGISSSD